MISVKQKRPMNFSMKFDTDFNGGDITCQCSTSMNLIPYPHNGTAVAFISLSAKFVSLKSNFTLAPHITIPFEIYPKDGIKPMDLYDCVIKTKSHLQGIINATFLGSPTPNLTNISFDEIADIISDNIEKI